MVILTSFKKSKENIVLSYSSKKDNKNHYFLCYNGNIGQMIVILDEDRSKYLYEEWKPKKYGGL